MQENIKNNPKLITVDIGFIYFSFSFRTKAQILQNTPRIIPIKRNLMAYPPFEFSNSRVSNLLVTNFSKYIDIRIDIIEKPNANFENIADFNDFLISVSCNTS